MNEAAFRTQVTELEEFLLAAITYFFEQRGVAFDPAELMGEGSVDLNVLAKEAHFYGADLFPDEQPVATTICA